MYIYINRNQDIGLTQNVTKVGIGLGFGTGNRNIYEMHKTSDICHEPFSKGKKEKSLRALGTKHYHISLCDILHGDMSPNTL